MKIKSIKIEKLYGKYDFDWDLRSDINIIAGDNGSYKTTLLNIIASLCEPKSVPERHILKGATLEMTENISVKFRISDLTLKACVIAIKQGESKLSVGNFKKLRIFNKISTFDVPPLRNDMSSSLGQQLGVLESEYAYYLSDLSKQLSVLIHQAGKVDMEDMKKIYATMICLLRLSMKLLNVQIKLLTQRKVNCSLRLGMNCWKATSVCFLVKSSL